MSGEVSPVLRFIRKIAALPSAGQQTDGQLLERFLRQRDATAFAVLVHRYGPLVLSICRRVLRHEQDAEDAFQATFLVLVRKADSIAKREALSSWLYGVAYRVARKAHASTARRQAQQTDLHDVPAAECTPEVVWRDLRPVLDAEVSRLPPKYRAPFVLCYLEGKTNAQAAQELGRPLGTVVAQLARARQRLRERLARHGLALAAGAWTTLLSQNAAPAALPVALADFTIEAALPFAAGKTAAAARISAAAVALTEGVLHTMWMTKVKTVAAMLLAVAALTTGTGMLAYRTLGEEPRQGPNANGRQPASQEDAQPKADQEKLQGTWKAVTVEEKGESKKDTDDVLLIFSKDEFSLKKGDLNFHKGKFTLDPSQNPKAIDMAISESSKEMHQGKTSLGIYALEGDTLKWCANIPGSTERPKEFSSADTEHMLATFQRAKP